MSNNLIPVFTGIINNEQSQLVDARLLHQFLEVKTQFKDWIARRVNEYQFVENQDYILVAQKRAINGRGGDRRSKDYHLTIDMAKELSMVERTEKGREARRYFIECERKLLKLSENICTKECQDRTISATQAEIIRNAVEDYCKRYGVKWQKLYPELKAEFGIESYLDLLAKDFDAFIAKLNYKRPYSSYSEEETIKINTIALCNHMIWVSAWFIEYEDAIRKFNNRLGATLIDRFHDGRGIAKDLLGRYDAKHHTPQIPKDFPWGGESYEQRNSLDQLLLL